MFRFRMLSVALAFIFTTEIDAQVQVPSVVSKIKQQMKVKGKNVPFAEKGDVMTKLEEKEDKGLVLVRTTTGREGWVKSKTIAPLRDAAPIYSDLIRAKPRDANLYILRSSVWALRGETEKAIADCSKALSLGRNDGDVYMNRGVYYATLRDFDKAIADYNEAIRLGKNDVAVLVNRAMAYVAKQDFDRAMKDFDELIKRDPKDPRHYVQRGSAWQHRKEYDKALADYNKALAIDKEHLGAISSRGFVYYLQGKHAKAVKDFDEVIRIDPYSAMALNNRGFNQQMLGRFAEALKNYDEAIRIAPKFAMAQQNKAWLLATCPDEKIRDGRAAFAAAREACTIREFKDYTDIKALAAAYAESGDFKHAVENQQRVVEMTEGETRKLEQEILELYKSAKPYRFTLKVASTDANKK